MVKDAGIWPVALTFPQGLSPYCQAWIRHETLRGGKRSQGFGDGMDTQQLWIREGRLESINTTDARDLAVEDRLLGEGYVQIIVERDLITVRWHLFAPNWASLYYAMDWLAVQEGRCRLEYFAAGWFTEDFEDVLLALPRIRHLMDKSDIFLRSRVFIKQADLNKAHVPTLLQDVLMKGSAPDEYAVDCVEDPESHAFRVTHIGERTPIAERWGMTPVCFPCMNGNDYDQIVSSVYPHVLKTGQPHYDHVYAAMQENDGRVSWVPYQRVVLPMRFRDGRKGVRVVSRIAPVDIQVI